MTPVPTVLAMQHARPAPPGGVAAVVYPAAAPHPSRAQVVPLVNVPATTGARFLQPNLQNYQQQAAAMQAADDAQRALDAASTPPGSVVCVASVGDGPAPNVTFDRRNRAFPLALGANALVVALLVLYTWKCAEMHAHVAAAEAGVKQHVGCFRAPNVSASADVSVLQTSSTADGPGVCFVWGFRDLVEGDADYENQRGAELWRGSEAHPRGNSSQYIGVQARGRPVGGDPGGGGTGASPFLLDDGNEDGGDGRGRWTDGGRYPTACLYFDAAPEDVFGTDAAVEDCHWDLRGNSATVSVFLNPYRAIPGQVLTNVPLGILVLVFGIVLSVYACIAVVLGGGRNDARCGGADVNYLSNMQSGGIQVYFDAVRREKPELVMKVTCYREFSSLALLPPARAHGVFRSR
jgi:hypothetical protein